MRVILKTGGYCFDNEAFGKKVIARPSHIGNGVLVRGSELQRVSKRPETIDANFYYFYAEGEFDVVEPQFINCTDNSTCREDWEEYYERKGSV